MEVSSLPRSKTGHHNVRLKHPTKNRTQPASSAALEGIRVNTNLINKRLEESGQHSDKGAKKSKGTSDEEQTSGAGTRTKSNQDKILAKLSELKTEVLLVQKNQSKLMKKLEQVENDFSCYIYDVDKAPYKDQLLSEIGKEIIKSLSREIHESAFEKILTSAMPDSDKRNAHRTRMALKWCREKATRFRVDERRKLLGITPYIKFKAHGTPKLARQIMGVYKVPIDLTTEKMYTRHLAIVRKFIREEPVLSAVRGKLYSNFLTWMRGKYGGEPTSTEWNVILNEDGRRSCSGTKPAVATPVPSQESNPYRIECGNSQPSESSQETTGEMSPQLF